MDGFRSDADMSVYGISYWVFIPWKPWEGSMNTLSQYLILAWDNLSRGGIIQRQNNQSLVDYPCSEIEKACSNWIWQSVIGVLCRSKEYSKRCRRNRRQQRRRVDKRWKDAQLIYLFYYAWWKRRLYCCSPRNRYREQKAREANENVHLDRQDV